jgi:hypothetical protein
VGQVEKLLKIIIVINIIAIFIGQYLIQKEEIAPYVNKSIYYEGVVKKQHVKIIETIDHNN